MLLMRCTVVMKALLLVSTLVLVGGCGDVVANNVDAAVDDGDGGAVDDPCVGDEIAF